MTPQKKLNVHPQLIAIALSASPTSTTSGGRTTHELQSHDSQIYKYNYYYYHITHLNMHITTYTYIGTRLQSL